MFNMYTIKHLHTYVHITLHTVHARRRVNGGK